MLHEADGGALRKDGQNVEPELGGELEPGKHQDAGEQAPKLGQPLRFIGLQPAEVLEQLQILDLAPEVGVAPDRVVVGQGDGVETAFFGAVQDVEDADAGLLVVDGGRGVNMKVDAAPRQILCRRCLGNAGRGFWRSARPLTRRVATVEPGDDAVGAFSRRLRGGGIEQLLPERGRRCTVHSGRPDAAPTC